MVHASHNVQNPGNAVSKDKTDFALLTPPIIAGNSYLDISFSQPGTAGKKVGFNLGEGNTVLSADLLAGITLTVYNTNGSVVVRKSDFTLADAEVLPNGKFNLNIKTPKGSYNVGRGRITFSGLVNVLTTLKVYGINAHQNCNTLDVQDGNADVAVKSIDLQVAPNPFNAYTTLNFKTKLNHLAAVVISDKAGNIIEQHRVDGASSIRLLEKAPAGIYFVKIISGNSVETRKVIKM